MPSLLVNHDDQRQEVSVATDNFLIGRDPTNQLVICDVKVSRFHCRLTRQGAQYRLEDLDSASGTLLEGQKVTDAILADGQAITVGPANIVFVDDSGAQEDDPGVCEHGLYFIGGPLSGDVAIFSDTIQIGRAPDCELIVEGTLVSNYHCSIKSAPEGFFLQDLGSTNGTLLNDTKTAEALLTPGDQITVGEHRMLFDAYPPAPLTADQPATSGLLRTSVELCIFSAICLLLWSLLAGIVIKPLVGPTRAKAPTGTISFQELGPDLLPKHYRFESTGNCEIALVRGEGGGIRVQGSDFAGKEFRAFATQVFPLEQGWTLTGSARATRRSPSISLYADYLDERGHLLVRAHSQLAHLDVNSTTLTGHFGPQPGAAQIRFGYALVGDLGEVLLGPLRLVETPTPAEESQTLDISPGKRITLSPAGEVTLTSAPRALIGAEFGNMEEGEWLGGCRHFELGSQIGQSDVLYRRATQVGPPPEKRFPFAITARQQGEGVLVRYEGPSATTHVKWRWSKHPDNVSLFYRGTPVAQNRQRLLLDEMVIRWAGDEFTCRFKPPVYRESRWQDDAGEYWQLRFAEHRPQLDLTLQPGNRQRARAVELVRDRYLKARLRKDLSACIKLLDRWASLAGRVDTDLAEKQRLIRNEAENLVEQTLSLSGATSLARISATLESLRGTIYEDPLEAELARRILTDIQGPQRPRAAKLLLDRARNLAVEGYLSLARVALGLLIQHYPKTPSYAPAVQLLSRLQN